MFPQREGKNDMFPHHERSNGWFALVNTQWFLIKKNPERNKQITLGKFTYVAHAQLNWNYGFSLSFRNFVF